MGFFRRLGAFLRGAEPAAVYADTAQVAGFLQAPTSPAPDAKALIEHEMASAVIGRCVNVISEDAASVPLRLFDVTRPDEPREIFDHPAIVLWRWINRVQSPVVYLQQLFADVLTEGNHFGVLGLGPTGTPESIIRMPPQHVKVNPHPARIVDSYTWKRPDGKEETYRDDRVVHVMTRNPDYSNVYRGLGNLARGRDQIRLENYLRQWKEFQIKNGVPVSVIFKLKRGYVNDAELERFRQETVERMSGLRNSNKPMFIRAEDVDIQVIDRPKEDEVAFINSLKYTRSEFAMLFGVPPSRLSDYSDSFRATSPEQTRQYWQDTIMFWHRLLLDYLNSVFLPRWFPADVDQRTLIPRIQFSFDYTKVRALALSTRDMATAQEILIRNGMRTPNEGRMAMGDSRSDDPAADLLYMNGKPLGTDASGSQPGSQPTGGEDRPPGSNEPDEDEDGGRDVGGDGAGFGNRRVPLVAVGGKS